jgi:hypothetical protein
MKRHDEIRSDLPAFRHRDTLVVHSFEVWELSMNFVRSRLTVVGLLAAWPVSQLAGCAAKDREFGPANNAGEGASGGSSAGKGGNGGSSGEGNTSGSTGSGASGGAAGDDGSGGTGGGNSGGSGNATTGGSSGSMNAAGDAGAESNGGEGGDATIPDPECIPTGTELCADGLDNDCDGATDCLVLQAEFPTRNGAASGADVAYTFSEPAATATLQCRVSHGSTPGGLWRACARVSGSTVHPFSEVDSADPAKNGLYYTEVRLRFPTGGISDAFRRLVYIHDSLHGAERCDTGIDTATWVATASSWLPPAGAFQPATLRNPFVEIDFDPLVSSTFAVAEGDGLVKWRTLRRRFSLSADNQYLVMTRTYTARAGAAGMGCLAAVKRVHTARGTDSAGVMAFQNCEALVFNKTGAGMCLATSAGVPVSAEYDFSAAQTQLIPPDYVVDVDNFAWRKMGAFNVLENGTRRQSNFSPKCDDEGCASDYTLFLPDKSFFAYWSD